MLLTRSSFLFAAILFLCPFPTATYAQQFDNIEITQSSEGSCNITIAVNTGTLPATISCTNEEQLAATLKNLRFTSEVSWQEHFLEDEQTGIFLPDTWFFHSDPNDKFSEASPRPGTFHSDLGMGLYGWNIFNDQDDTLNTARKLIRAYLENEYDETGLLKRKPSLELKLASEIIEGSAPDLLDDGLYNYLSEETYVVTEAGITALNGIKNSMVPVTLYEEVYYGFHSTGIVKTFPAFFFQKDKKADKVEFNLLLPVDISNTKLSAWLLYNDIATDPLANDEVDSIGPIEFSSTILSCFGKKEFITEVYHLCRSIFLQTQIKRIEQDEFNDTGSE